MVGIVFLYVMWFVIVAFMLLPAVLTSRGSG